MSTKVITITLSKLILFSFPQNETEIWTKHQQNEVS